MATGTVALLIGYAFQAAALDRGRLAIIQPLLVTTVVVEFLHEGLGVMLSHWQCYALALAGVLGFVLQQVSLERSAAMA